MRYAQDLNAFNTKSWGDVSVIMDEFTQKILEVAIPVGEAPYHIFEQLTRAYNDAIKLGV